MTLKPRELRELQKHFRFFKPADKLQIINTDDAIRLVRIKLEVQGLLRVGSFTARRRSTLLALINGAVVPKKNKPKQKKPNESATTKTCTCGGNHYDRNCPNRCSPCG